MAFVPKRIADLVRTQGWRVETVHNIAYGGSGHASMVTWVLRFHWDLRVTSTPDAVYRDSVRSVLSAPGLIAENGTLTVMA